MKQHTLNKMVNMLLMKGRLLSILVKTKLQRLIFLLS